MRVSYLFWFAMGAMLSLMFDIAGDPERQVKKAQRTLDALSGGRHE